MHKRDRLLIHRHLQFIVPAALLLFAGGCAARHVSIDYAHSVDFAPYHTYSWLKVKASNGLWEDRIRRDVDAQLASKGWTEVPSGGQAAVTAFGSTQQQPTLETFYDSFGPGFGGWYWGGFGYGYGLNEGISTTQTVYTPIGTLVVDIFNANSKHLIWRGTAQDTLTGSPEKNKTKLEKNVAIMFKNFPPPSKG